MLHLVHPPSSIEARIRLAIANKRLVEVGYKGRARVAEPHDYGKQKGMDRLLVYQLRVPSSSGRDAMGWRLFDVAKIESLAVLDTVFKGSRRTSDQVHHQWDVLYARVD
ncbi:MAG TPA: hypothetical protein VFZ38_11340 [Vicinamibacterales bacterium]